MTTQIKTRASTYRGASFTRISWAPRLSVFTLNRAREEVIIYHTYTYTLAYLQRQCPRTNKHNRPHKSRNAYLFSHHSRLARSARHALRTLATQKKTE